jgi:cytoskeletal protein CcmA (bactofilin family)
MVAISLAQKDGGKMKKYNDDYIDGRYVKPLIITDNFSLVGEHTGTIYIETGEFTLLGRLKGSLNIQKGATAEIIGKQQGSVSIEAGASVTVTGAIEGSATLERGGTLIIEEGAKLAGSLHNNGEVILRGAFGGAQSGEGNLIIEDTGYIKEPIVKDGSHYYYW